MKNSVFLFFLIIVSINSYGQDNRTVLYGTIKSEGAELQNIHVLNKSSKKGAITDSKGRFTIEVQEKDTLIVTGIQFYYLEVSVTKQHITEKTLTIDLLQKMNELEEVEVKHNLTGNITVDADEIKIEKHVKGEVLDFSKVDLNLVDIKIDESSRSRTSNDSELMPNMNPDLIAIAFLLLEPIAKEVVKIGATKRNIKKYERRYQNKVLQAPANIRTDFGDTFFTETLKIPADHIDEFIATCLSKGVANLYVDNKKIGVIDLFLRESKIYLEQIKNEH
ncbi:carboxypeptidase-like regulatory domain-containing protein [Aureibaculum sp. 2210JD6-5]|uniref:carboxypeptidase-like regulatory domain-containing protein n=1 Tax=Aureibaculum sp. 2210JD6-5 TaxID=3103957 RepID=UPI002AACBC68|nr:carboxypeptidase-like regulatory domain-containing protein [Aureibaculum sp. 2210JD6-5]MDY7394006.1 carboxypeptidase-like regulatory domain-containing protein [Aureibaculum sp. 2210JD6-5]